MSSQELQWPWTHFPSEVSAIADTPLNGHSSHCRAVVGGRSCEHALQNLTVPYRTRAREDMSFRES